MFPFELQNENEEKIKFEIGDILKFGVKKNISADSYDLYKQLKIEEEIEEVQFEFSSEETQSLDVRDYIVELELTRGEYVDTIYQQQIFVKGDVVNNESKINSNT